MNIPIGSIASQANDEDFDRSYQEHCDPQDFLAEMFMEFLKDGGTISDAQDCLVFLDEEGDHWAHDSLEDMAMSATGVPMKGGLTLWR